MRRSSEWVCKYALPIANRRLSGHVGPTALANSSITWGRLRAAPVFAQLDRSAYFICRLADAIVALP
jgi:hypothetical protein